MKFFGKLMLGIAAAVAAIITGGAAAIALAEKLFWACLSAKLSEALVSVDIVLTSQWGDWE